MDDNTGWSLLCCLAVLVAGSLAGWALAMTPQQYARGWVFLLSTLPLLGWLILWSIMGNSNDHWRRLLSAGVGIVIGPVFVYGLSEIVAYKSKSRINTTPASHVIAAVVESPKIGSIRMIQSNLQVKLSVSKSDAEVQVQAELINDSDELIQFHAITAGNINGVWFNVNKVEFDGYAYPHQPFYLLSNKVEIRKPSKENNQDYLKLVAVYEYTLHYKFAAEVAFSRITQRGIKVEQEVYLKLGKRGTQKVIPYVSQTYGELEE